MEPKITYEDGELIVLDKPAGWIVNKSATTKDQPVIQDWLEKKNYPLAKAKKQRSGIVHRIDKETSGLLLVAKNKHSFDLLQKQFKERKVKKTYKALVHGKLEPVEGDIEAPVGRLPWNRVRFGVLAGGRKAQTKYCVIEYYLRNKEIFSLAEFYPKTGRTHQIRIHAKYINFPIVSDGFYAGRKTSRDDRRWCPRMFLHASGISFTHPGTGRWVEYKSELPEDLNSALKKLSKIKR